MTECWLAFTLGFVLGLVVLFLGFCLLADFMGRDAEREHPTLRRRRK